MLTLRPFKYPPIKGEEVKVYQELVTTWGFYKGEIDGEYTAKSWKACSAFQEYMGMRPDSQCGAKVWAYLESPVFFGLHKWGLIPIYRKKGYAFAVQQFQVVVGLRPTGIVDDKTLEWLGREPIVPRFNEDDMKCQCGYCRGYPCIEMSSLPVRMLAERIFCEIESVYPDATFYIATRTTPTQNGANHGGYRCKRWNRERGGAPNSTHVKGLAIDFWGHCPSVDDAEFRQILEDTALRLNPYGGVGCGARCLVHIDTYAQKRRWRYWQ